MGGKSSRARQHEGQVLVHLPVPMSDEEAELLDDASLATALKALSGTAAREAVNRLQAATKRRNSELVLCRGKAIQLILRNKVVLDLTAPIIRQWLPAAMLCYLLPVPLSWDECNQLAGVYEQLDKDHHGRLPWPAVVEWLIHMQPADHRAKHLLVDRLQLLVATVQIGVFSPAEFVHFMVALCTASDDELTRFAFCSIANDTTTDGSRIVNVQLLRDRLSRAQSDLYSESLFDGLGKAATPKQSLFASVVAPTTAGIASAVAEHEFLHTCRDEPGMMAPLLAVRDALMTATIGPDAWGAYRDTALRHSGEVPEVERGMDIASPSSCVPLAARPRSTSDDEHRGLKLKVRTLRSGSSSTQLGSRTINASASTADSRTSAEIEAGLDSRTSVATSPHHTTTASVTMTTPGSSATPGWRGFDSASSDPGTTETTPGTVRYQPQASPLSIEVRYLDGPHRSMRDASSPRSDLATLFTTDNTGPDGDRFVRLTPAPSAQTLSTARSVASMNTSRSAGSKTTQ